MYSQLYLKVLEKLSENVTSVTKSLEKTPLPSTSADLYKQSSKLRSQKAKKFHSSSPNWKLVTLPTAREECTVVISMDPATFAANYGYPALPPLPPGIRYPYPASTAAPTAVSSGRGMIYYPQALSVEKSDIDVDVEGTDTDGCLDDSPRLVVCRKRFARTSLVYFVHGYT